MVRKSQFEIWITVKNENPDMEDIANAEDELIKMGINYKGKVGIAFTRMQWINFLQNSSRFEIRFSNITPAAVLGFPVRMISEQEK